TNAAMAVQIKTLVGPKFDYDVFTSLAIPDGELVGVVPEALLWGYDGAAKIDTAKDTAMVYQDMPPVPPGAAIPADRRGRAGRRAGAQASPKTVTRNVSRG